MKRRLKPDQPVGGSLALARAFAQADFSDANRLLLRLLRDLDPGDLDGQQALDLGCGSGDIAIALLKAWPGARCDALDGTAPMLAYAQTALDALPGVAQRSPAREPPDFRPVPAAVPSTLATPPSCSPPPVSASAPYAASSNTCCARAAWAPTPPKASAPPRPSANCPPPLRPTSSAPSWTRPSPRTPWPCATGP